MLVDFHRELLTHALALSAIQFVHKKKSPRIYTSMHSGGFELTKLAYTRLEDNLIRHRGDRLYYTTMTCTYLHCCRREEESISQYADLRATRAIRVGLVNADVGEITLSTSQQRVQQICRITANMAQCLRDSCVWRAFPVSKEQGMPCLNLQCGVR